MHYNGHFLKKKWCLIEAQAHYHNARWFLTAKIVHYYDILDLSLPIQ